MRHRIAAAVAAAALALCSLSLPAVALAEGESSEELQATADQLRQEVQERVRTYNEAVGRVEELEGRISQTEASISDVEAQLPELRERAGRSIKRLYKMSEDDTGLVGLVLCSEDFEGFVANIEYLNAVTEHEAAQVQELHDTQANLEAAKATLEEQRQEADAERQEADEALAQAQEAADRAQEAADAARAEEEARIAAAAAGTGATLTQASSPEEAIATTNALAREAGIAVADDTGEAGEGREAFVERWASRIDAYLPGRPLAGQGRAFAEAAWDSGIDPRWSAATSMVESGGGAACFASYNAYGWLARGGFSSWEEGVREHASYLRGTYGTSFSPAAAALYLMGDPTALEESNEYYLSVMTEIARI